MLFYITIFVIRNTFIDNDDDDDDDDDDDTTQHKSISG